MALKVALDAAQRRKDDHEQQLKSLEAHAAAEMAALRVKAQADERHAAELLEVAVGERVKAQEEGERLRKEIASAVEESAALARRLQDAEEEVWHAGVVSWEGVEGDWFGSLLLSGVWEIGMAGVGLGESFGFRS